MTEDDTLVKVKALIESRQKELLMPSGLRGSEYAKWPFETMKLIEPLTYPSNYDTQTTEKAKEQDPEPVAKGKSRLPKRKG